MKGWPKHEPELMEAEETEDQKVVNDYYQAAARDLCKGMRIDPDQMMATPGKLINSFLGIRRWKLEVPELHRLQMRLVALDNTIESRLPQQQQQPSVQVPADELNGKGPSEH